ncbi:MAG: hypothetical protein ACJ8CN_11820, partial [Gemmatimonadales bacterium]
RHLYAWGLLTFLLAAFTAHEVFIPAPYAAQFGVRTAPEQGGTHHPNDFSQELVLAVQAPFDLGHEVFRQPQVIESLLEGLGGVLRLAAVSLEALVRCAITAPSGFGVFLCTSFG